MLYGWREGAKRHWCGARDQGDVWQIKKPVRNEFHPCLPAGQQVFFNGKWKNIEDVGIGDRNQYGEVRAKTEHEAERLVEIQAEGQTTVATWNHPFLVKRDKGVFWIEAEKLKPGDALLVSKFLEEDTCGESLERDIYGFADPMEERECCTILSGKLSTVPSRRDTRYITGMGISSTITLKTSSLSHPLSTSGFTLVADLTNEEYGKSPAKFAGSSKNARQNIGISTKTGGYMATDADHAQSEKSLKTAEFALRMVGSVSTIQRRTKVYNLSVSPLPLFDTKVGISHNTMKPVELFDRCLRNSSEPGALVLDCFAGSGTTLIACEKAGRVARLMEIDPKYADVIVRRWQEFTGKKAVRESDGTEFDVVPAS